MKIPSIPASLLLLVLTMCTNLVAAAQLSNHHSSALSQNSSAKLIIDDIICRGNDTTACAFVTNKYFQAVGDELDPEEIADARLRLGTLIQFQSVSVYLEKGKQRNHVVVVFDVVEASNLFYEFGFDAHHRNLTVEGLDHYKNDMEEGDFNARVTNFNFLGTGKELSLSVSLDRTNRETVSRFRSIRFTDVTTNELFEYYADSRDTENQRATSLNIGYFDPHLFETSHYYMSVNLRFNNFRRSVTRREFYIEPDNLPTYVERESNNNDWYQHSLLLGRRFARYSFVAVDVTHIGTSFDDDTDFGVTVGWNSEDDILLPTKGSRFSTRISKDHGLWEIDLNYKQNVALKPNKILSLSANVLRNLQSEYCSTCALNLINAYSATLIARYTDITPIDKARGEYSSWFVQTLYGQTNIGEVQFNGRFLGIGAGYTYQTESMIYRFSLAFTDQEDN